MPQDYVVHVDQRGRTIGLNVDDDAVSVYADGEFVGRVPLRKPKRRRAPMPLLHMFALAVLTGALGWVIAQLAILIAMGMRGAP